MIFQSLANIYSEFIDFKFVCSENEHTEKL